MFSYRLPETARILVNYSDDAADLSSLYVPVVEEGTTKYDGIGEWLKYVTNIEEMLDYIELVEMNSYLICQKLRKLMRFLLLKI